MHSIERAYLISNDDTILIGVILLFVLYTFVLYRSRVVFLYRFTTFFSSRQIYASNEVKTSDEERLDILFLILIGCLSVSTIFYTDYITHTGTGSDFSLLSTLFLVVSLLIIAKGLIYSLINWTFFDDAKGRTWFGAVFFSVAIISTLAFPLSLINIFCKNDLINVSDCIIGLVILQKLLLLCKLFVNFRPKKYGSLLFFLYFCSVEVLPTLIIWHIIREMMI